MEGIGGLALATGAERRRIERRSRLARPHWPERRTGFDRRSIYPVTQALASDTTLLIALAFALNVLNILDLLLTTLGLSLGVTEANPVMAAAFQQGWLTAAAFKIGVMIAVTLGIWMFRRYRRVLQVAIAATAVYAALAVYHVWGLSLTL